MITKLYWLHLLFEGVKYSSRKPWFSLGAFNSNVYKSKRSVVQPVSGRCFPTPLRPIGFNIRNIIRLNRHRNF
jgi:hypothetical protein